MSSIHDPPDKKRLDAAKTAYWQSLSGGIVGFFSNLNSTWYGEHALHYRQEREVLKRYVTPFYMGLGATIFVFVTFRVTGTPSFQQFRQKWIQWNRPPSKNVKAIETKKPEEFMSHLERQRMEKEQDALRSIKALTDILVSLSVGTSSILLLLDAEKDTMRKDFEDAPLVQGRSVIAETICPDMMQSAESFKLPLDAVRSDANLMTFTEFVSNCRLRAEHEAEIREEKGKTREEPVEIPYPGLKYHKIYRSLG